MGLLGLATEWIKTFGEWRATDKEIDDAIELCKTEWGRVPENVTRGFMDMLNKAIAKNKPLEIVQEKGYWDTDAEHEAGTKICARIKQQNPEFDWMHDVPKMFNSLKITARQQNPAADNLGVLRAVWGML